MEYTKSLRCKTCNKYYVQGYYLNHLLQEHKKQTNIKKSVHIKDMNKDNIFTSITTISLIVALFATASIMQQQANGQIIRDGIDEDQVIICVNGHVVELAGNICKVFNVDDQSLTEAQEDLYKNPDNDTFDMEVLD